MTLNLAHPTSGEYQKQLAVRLMKGNSSSLQFKLLQLSQDFRLQRWKWEAEQTEKSLLPLIPQTKGLVQASRAWYGKTIGNFQQIIYQDLRDKQNYSVLFNYESGREKEDYLKNKIGDFPITLNLNTAPNENGLQGSFIKTINYA